MADMASKKGGSIAPAHVYDDRSMPAAGEPAFTPGKSSGGSDSPLAFIDRNTGGIGAGSNIPR